MRRRKLLIGLVSAGAFSAGFGAAVFPAAAQLRTITVKLVDGQTVTVQVDAPADTPVDQVPLPVTEPVASATETPTPTTTAEPAPDPAPPAPTTTSAAPTTTAAAPAPPADPSTQSSTTTAPAATSTAPSTTTATTTTTTTSTTGPATTAAPDAGAVPTVSAGGQHRQKTSGKALRAPSHADAAAGDAASAAPDGGSAQGGAIRQTDGVPTPSNPTFTQADVAPAPIGVPNFFIDKFRIPPFLLPIYQAAGIQYGIRWEILAGINEIETDYGRNLNVSTAGAVGWMQFMPSTWKQWGVDANHDGKKDPYNPVDAIFAAARYLKAAGADTDIRRAIFAYNHADWYVDSVLMRARLIGGLPADLVGSLTGLTEGRFPVAAKATYADDLTERSLHRKIATGHNAALPVEANSSRHGINIYAKAGAPAVATQDGRVVRIGKSKRLGRFVQLRDVYGNTYTYAHLKKVATAYGVPKARKVTKAQVASELHLPKDPKPTQAASAGTQPRKHSAPAVHRGAARPHPAAAHPTSATPAALASTPAPVQKERLFANPSRPQAYHHGGHRQLVHQDFAAHVETYRAQFTKLLGLKGKDIRVKRLKVGAQVVAGTVLGRIGKVEPHVAPHLLFEIRPAGKHAPRIDPKPILDGWKLLESTAIYRAAGKNPFFGPDAKDPSIGQILLMSKESLQRRVLADSRIQIYACGRQDIQSGVIDRRVLATLEFLAASGLKPTVSALECGHGLYTTSGNVSEHSTGDAVDIAAINGIPILGHQGEGSITDMTIRRLLTLQGTMKPHQIISLMTYPGTDNTLALPDHADHIHVGFHPLYGTDKQLGRQVNATLKPKQWIKLIDRLGQIDNPKVPTKVSKYALDVAARGSDAHQGD